MTSDILPPELIQAAIDADSQLTTIQTETALESRSTLVDKEYPLEALGPLLGNAAKAIAEVVQLPAAIAAQSVLAAASMAAQQQANVEIDGRVYPLSLFCLTVAESGDRKSSADKIAKKPLDDWQRDLIEKYQRTQKRDRAQGGNSSTDTASRAQPTYPYLFSDEPTLEGLHKRFSNGYPSQGLFSDEGGQFFGGQAMNKDNALKTVAGLSKFWDGSSINRTRAGEGESSALYNRRLTVHLLVQPIVAQRVLSDPLLMQQGLLARFLMACPRSIAGDRPYNHRNPNSESAIRSYWERMKGLLELPIAIDDHGGLSLKTLTLDPRAKSLWIDSYNSIEANLKSGRRWESIRPTGAKMSENIARIAGVIAVADGADSIQEQHMQGAIQLGQFYLSEQWRIVQRANQASIEWLAEDTVEWIKDRGGVASIEELQKGPRSIRKSVNRIRDVMAILVEQERCVTTGYNSSGKPSEWRLNDI